MLDSEFTASAVRGLLNLTATEVDDLLVGASGSGTGASTGHDLDAERRYQHQTSRAGHSR